MTIDIDQHAINNMTVAIGREMTPLHGKRHPNADTVLIGGPQQPTDAEKSQLASFGLRKNYKVIFPAFDPADVQTEGPYELAGEHVLERRRGLADAGSRTAYCPPSFATRSMASVQTLRELGTAIVY